MASAKCEAAGGGADRLTWRRVNNNFSEGMRTELRGLEKRDFVVASDERRGGGNPEISLPK